MGVFIFWVHYIIAFVLLWHILFCIYVKKYNADKWGHVTYVRTEEDKRKKHPLWAILIFIVMLCTPILNIIGFIVYLALHAFCESGDERNPHYIKSIFTKQL